MNKNQENMIVYSLLLLFSLEIDHKVKPSEPYLLEYLNSFFSTLLVVPVRVFSLSSVSVIRITSGNKCSLRLALTNHKLHQDLQVHLKV